MRLHVLAQGVTITGGLINSCDNVDLGYMTADEVIELIKSIPPPPPDYAEWECGVTVTVESMDRGAYVMVTVNGLDDYTVIKYDDSTGEEVLVSSSAPLSTVVRAVKAFYLEPSGRGLSPATVAPEEYGYNFSAESLAVIGYDEDGQPVTDWLEANLNVTNKAVSGVPFELVRAVRLLDPVPGRGYPGIIIEYVKNKENRVLRFRFRDMGTYWRAREAILRLVPRDRVVVG